MKFFTFILYFIFSLELSKILALIDGVSLSQHWPVPIDDLVSFTITKEFNTNSVLIVDILDKTEPVRKTIKIAKSNYVDWNTDYYIIKRDIEKTGTSSFIIKMSFRRKSDETVLTFRWFPAGLPDANSPDINSDSNIIYSKKIQLRAKWKIKVTVEVDDNSGQRVLNTEERYFQIGKIVKITCSAHDGLPKARVNVNGINYKRFRDIAFDENLNTWVGYLTLTLSDHNSNISCSVAGTDNIESVQIKVNHVPTQLVLDPDYNGYTKNGSKIRCISLDGYPSPIIKWDYVLIKNHSNPKSLYQINGDTLTINSNVQTGTEMIFNCTAVYTNPLQNEVQLIRKDFNFVVGEASKYIETNSSTEKSSNITDFVTKFEKLNKAVIGAAVAGVVIMIIAISIVVMLCRSKPKPPHSSTHRQEGSPKYAGSLLAGSKTALHNQMKSQNGANSAFIPADTNVNSEQNEFNYDDMPRGRRPIKVVDEPVVYSTIIGTMQPKVRPSLDLGPIDRV